MNDSELVLILASIMLSATPLIIAVCGEILTERVGVVNLSLDGSMLMGAMVGFVVAFKTDSLALGFATAAVVGMIFAFIIAYGSIRLKQSQVAIGFVLTLLGHNLSAFLGQNYSRLPGPSVAYRPIPILKDLPIVGPIFFNHSLLVYFALILVFVTWYFLNKTQLGLQLRSVGERPSAAFARGIDVNKLRYFYTCLGGALVGIAGAAYSLSIKIGWSDGHTRGFGWIALAIVIFGGWSPVKGMFGALLFGASKALATLLQKLYPEISVVAFNVLPWILMLAVLVFVGSGISDRIVAVAPEGLKRPLSQLLRVSPPLALGTPFDEET